MHQITKDEALSLLQKMRQIRQTSEEMIACLEHMMQLQNENSLRELSYNPDDYLEEARHEEFDRVRKNTYYGCPCGCMPNEQSYSPVNDTNRFQTTFEQEEIAGRKEQKT